MIVLLHGAKKNVGDFLIASKSKELISDITKESDFLELDRWRSLDNELDKINKSRAVFICGGPAYGRSFFPDLLPMTNELTKIKVPIIPFGIGLEGIKSTEIEKFEFTSSSLAALKYLHNNIKFSGVRDEITLRVMKKAGIENVVLTGCPVMYNKQYSLQDFIAPARINKIVITPPAGKTLHAQAFALGYALRKRFTDAKIVASFHRGTHSDKYTNRTTAAVEQGLVYAYKLLGINSLDTSYSVEKIKFYNDFDLHVGYRVHAHVYFTSINKPTFLLQEDTRGIGMTNTLGLEQSDVFAESNAVSKIIKNIDDSIQIGFCNFKQLTQRREELYKSMQAVVGQI